MTITAWRRAVAVMLFIGGVLQLSFGALFVLQGAGVVRWPADSFMIDRSGWIAGGIVIMIVGVGGFLAARRYWSLPARSVKVNRAP